MNDYPFQERRSGRDRRARPTSPLTLGSLFGRRARYRRKEDAAKYFFVDVYGPRPVFLILFTLVLSIADAFLTLRLLEGQFGELNPVMDFFLELGPFQFVTAKLAMTVFGLLVLLVLKNYYLWPGKIRTAILLAVFPFLYLVLVVYEVAMVMRG